MIDLDYLFVIHLTQIKTMEFIGLSRGLLAIVVLIGITYLFGNNSLAEIEY